MPHGKKVGLIPARKGSQGLKNKCVYPVLARPLVEYTIQAAKNSAFLDEVYVTTDCTIIKKIALEHNVSIIDRPANLADNNATSQDLVAHAIEEIGLGENDIAVLLQPTSPLRNTGHIDSALKMFDQHPEIEAVYSVISASEKPFKAFVKNKEGYLTGLIEKEYPFLRRQDLPEAFYSNGAIYAFNVGSFLKAKHGFDIFKAMPYIMACKDSIDVDSIEDIRQIESILKEDTHEKI